MATVLRVIKSTDTSAPTITGQVSSLINWCRTVGVSGFGSTAAAGWAEPFAAAGNIGAFRFDAATGTGAYINLDDSGSGTGGAKDCLVRAYKTMSALSTGTDPTPTVAQLAGGYVVHKSSAASATARPWVAVIHPLGVALFIDSAGGGLSTASLALFAFDIDTITPGDAYNFLIAAGAIQNPNSGQARSTFFGVSNATISLAIVGSGHLMRDNQATAGAVPCCLLGAIGNVSPQIGGGGLAYPHQPNAGMVLTRQVMVLESALKIRGTLKGVVWPWHDMPQTDNTTLPDEPTVGESLYVKSLRPNEGDVTTDGQVMFDITTPF